MTRPLRIFAAGSLRPAFDPLAARARPPLQLHYANARELARRITSGEPADVFAVPGTDHARGLREAGLAGPVRAFASNRVVVAVPAQGAARDAGVLAAPGTRVVIEVAGIPLGDFTRELLARMDRVAGSGFAARALANVVAEEGLVDDVAARLLGGDADAAVLYATDVAARAGRLRAIEVPAGAAVAVTLVACVTTGAADPARADAWVRALRAPPAEAILRAAGFGPAPS